MSIKISERYSFGWSDPIGIFGGTRRDDNPLGVVIERVPDDILKLSIKACRDLWMVRIGDAPVEVTELLNVPKGDVLWGIFRKLTDAGELLYEVDMLPDRVGRVETYKLKAEYGDN
jgi:hypothetical protein